MYTFLTQYNSPNYTPAADARAVWGRARTIEAVAIHWWDDPARNPSFAGVISTLCNPARQASAHFVATGTDRQVACLVDPLDASWATNSANPYTISIECDPRCRDEDYDVVAEVIADIRATFGDIPLVPHKQFASTTCPGNYDLSRLDTLSRRKTADPAAQYGASVKNITTVLPPPIVTPPTPPPVIVTPPAPTPLPKPSETDAKLDRIGAKVDENNALLKAIKSLLEGLIATITRIFK